MERTHSPLGYGGGDYTMTNNDDFFKDKKDMTDQSVNQQEVDKIKLGDTEYSQDELDKLVGLGKSAQEFQDKWNTPLDGLYKGYTKTTQELSELKNELQQLRDEKEQEKRNVPTGQELSFEDQRKEAIRQAEDLGLLHKGNVRDEVLRVLQARDLNNEVDRTVEDMSEKGLPKITGDELLDHMDKTGIKNPQKAYKDMFETQYDEWKEKQLTSVKKDGLITDTTAVAGGKEPEPVKITKDNLSELLAARLLQ